MHFFFFFFLVQVFFTQVFSIDTQIYYLKWCLSKLLDRKKQSPTPKNPSNKTCKLTHKLAYLPIQKWSNIFTYSSPLEWQINLSVNKFQIENEFILMCQIYQIWIQAFFTCRYCFSDWNLRIQFWPLFAWQRSPQYDSK